VLDIEMTGKRVRNAGMNEDEIFLKNLHSGDFQLNEELKRVEQRYIELALKESSNNMSKAAALLGVNRSTLYGRMGRSGE
jgi:DNA-binding NtrC family response regulator